MFRSAPASTFRCYSHQGDGDVVRVSLGGEIGSDDARVLDAALRRAEAAAPITVLDARAVTTIDPAALQLIHAAAGRARDHGRRLVILCVAGSPVSALDELDARIMTVGEPPANADTTSATFVVATDEQADLAVIEVCGEIDIATGPELSALLANQAAERRSIRLDMRGVEFMDSAGIHVLIGVFERARGDGHGFELITSEAVAHTLAVAGLREHFACLDRAPAAG